MSRPARGTFRQTISIHALREEGDLADLPDEQREYIISIHALREEGDDLSREVFVDELDFYPRPPRGGRRSSPPPGHRWSRYFYPRPPRGGRRLRSLSNLLSHLQNFYPRPPRGGRHFLTEDEDVINGFLSTPSARRATLQRGFDNQSVIFLSTPSARRATTALTAVLVSAVLISIHALREEGDYTSPCP